MKKVLTLKTKFNILILLFVFTLIFSSSVSADSAENYNAGFIVKCGRLYECRERLAISGENLVLFSKTLWFTYNILEIRVKIYSDDDYNMLKGKWLKLTLKKGKTYIDVPAIKVTDKTSVFKLSSHKFYKLFSSGGDYSVTVAGWEDYDSENDKMIGEIWRLNCNGSMWAPLIRYTNF